MHGELNPVGGGDPIPLLKTKLIIGRRPTCDICLPFPNISSQHCELELQNGYWHVQDLASRNGIKVNGVREESRFLLPGDEISVAKHAFEIAYEPTSDQPPPEEANPFAKSLMEKAGLTSKKKKPSQSDQIDLMGDGQAPVPSKRTPKPKGSSQDDQILGWLGDN
ncbi:FHA domain-containing protein [uncultured Rubinisphaera sp.]|uniref:FHA domain-containing protein n=1 Tax=uncultured Rubinisphaera sp. TaxID=1678686 RepID=UPI0030D8D206|tara:strand:+ start:1137 stop:1631 length:495 start_codon:yes stop_codon:yes gene_type:complete